ncbi:hypothetical protein HDU97_009333 [Phlyctochytrium planicorne]|nr:hypothetical protein HDU97_009333 [Phlyctochytrium planicorne]
MAITGLKTVEPGNMEGRRSSARPSCTTSVAGQDVAVRTTHSRSNSQRPSKTKPSPLAPTIQPPKPKANTEQLAKLLVTLQDDTEAEISEEDVSLTVKTLGDQFKDALIGVLHILSEENRPNATMATAIIMIEHFQFGVFYYDRSLQGTFWVPESFKLVLLENFTFWGEVINPRFALRFSFAAFPVVLFVAALGWLAYRTSQGRNDNPRTLNLARLLMWILPTILILPITKVLVTPFTCASFQAAIREYENVFEDTTSQETIFSLSCTSVTRLAFMVAGGAVLVVYALLALLVAFLVYDSNPAKKLSTSKSTGHVDVLTVLGKLVLSIGFVVVPGYEVFKILAVVLVSAILFVATLAYLPYYNHTWNKLRAGLHLASVFAGIVAIFAYIISTSSAPIKGYQVMSILLALSVIGYIIGHFITERAPMYITNYVSRKMELAELYETDEQDILVFFIPQHVEISARWLVANRMNDRQRKFSKEMFMRSVQVFRKGSFEFLDDPYVNFAFTSYLHPFDSDEERVTVQHNFTKNLKLPMDVKFQLDQIERKSMRSSAGVELNRIQFSEFCRLNTKARLFHYRSIKDIRLLWANLVARATPDISYPSLTQKPAWSKEDSGMVMDILGRLFADSEMADGVYAKLEKRFPRSTVVARAHALFCYDVSGLYLVYDDYYKGDQLMGKADLIVKESEVLQGSFEKLGGDVKSSEPIRRRISVVRTQSVKANKTSIKSSRRGSVDSTTAPKRNSKKVVVMVDESTDEDQEKEKSSFRDLQGQEDTARLDDVREEAPQNLTFGYPAIPEEENIDYLPRNVSSRRHPTLMSPIPNPNTTIYPTLGSLRDGPGIIRSRSNGSRDMYLQNQILMTTNPTSSFMRSRSGGAGVLREPSISSSVSRQASTKPNGSQADWDKGSSGLSRNTTTTTVSSIGKKVRVLDESESNSVQTGFDKPTISIAEEINFSPKVTIQSHDDEDASSSRLEGKASVKAGSGSTHLSVASMGIASSSSTSSAQIAPDGTSNLTKPTSSSFLTAPEKPLSQPPTLKRRSSNTDNTKKPDLFESLGIPSPSVISTSVAGATVVTSSDPPPEVRPRLRERSAPARPRPVSAIFFSQLKKNDSFEKAPLGEKEKEKHMPQQDAFAPLEVKFDKARRNSFVLGDVADKGAAGGGGGGSAIPGLQELLKAMESQNSESGGSSRGGMRSRVNTDMHTMLPADRKVEQMDSDDSMKGRTHTTRVPRKSTQASSVSRNESPDGSNAPSRESSTLRTRESVRLSRDGAEPTHSKAGGTLSATHKMQNWGAEMDLAQASGSDPGNMNANAAAALSSIIGGPGLETDELGMRKSVLRKATTAKSRSSARSSTAKRVPSSRLAVESGSEDDPLSKLEGNLSESGDDSEGTGGGSLRTPSRTDSVSRHNSLRLAHKNSLKRKLEAKLNDVANLPDATNSDEDRIGPLQPKLSTRHSSLSSAGSTSRKPSFKNEDPFQISIPRQGSPDFAPPKDDSPNPFASPTSPLPPYESPTSQLPNLAGISAARQPLAPGGKEIMKSAAMSESAASPSDKGEIRSAGGGSKDGIIFRRLKRRSEYLLLFAVCLLATVVSVLSWQFLTISSIRNDLWNSVLEIPMFANRSMLTSELYRQIDLIENPWANIDQDDLYKDLEMDSLMLLNTADKIIKSRNTAKGNEIITATLMDTGIMFGSSLYRSMNVYSFTRLYASSGLVFSNYLDSSESTLQNRIRSEYFIQNNFADAEDFYSYGRKTVYLKNFDDFQRNALRLILILTGLVTIIVAGLIVTQLIESAMYYLFYHQMKSISAFQYLPPQFAQAAHSSLDGIIQSKLFSRAVRDSLSEGLHEDKKKVHGHPVRNATRIYIWIRTFMIAFFIIMLAYIDTTSVNTTIQTMSFLMSVSNLRVAAERGVAASQSLVNIPPERFNTNFTNSIIQVLKDSEEAVDDAMFAIWFGLSSSGQSVYTRMPSDVLDILEKPSCLAFDSEDCDPDAVFWRPDLGFSRDTAMNGLRRLTLALTGALGACRAFFTKMRTSDRRLLQVLIAMYEPFFKEGWSQLESTLIYEWGSNERDVNVIRIILFVLILLSVIFQVVMVYQEKKRFLDFVAFAEQFVHDAIVKLPEDLQRRPEISREIVRIRGGDVTRDLEANVYLMSENDLEEQDLKKAS